MKRNYEKDYGEHTWSGGSRRNFCSSIDVALMCIVERRKRKVRRGERGVFPCMGVAMMAPGGALEFKGSGMELV